MGLEMFALPLLKAGLGVFQNSQANAINPQWHQYQSSPYAADQLGIAQQLFNGRMYGAGNLEKNIASSQSNTIGNIMRGATDGTQALQLATAAQGTADDAYNGLQTKELQNKYSLLDNLNKGYGAMINEGDKVYQSQLDKYKLDTGAQAAVRNSAWQNIFGAGNDAQGINQTLKQGKSQQDFYAKLFKLFGGGGNPSSISGGFPSDTDLAGMDG